MADQKIKFIAEWVDKGLKKGSTESKSALGSLGKAIQSNAGFLAGMSAAAAGAAVALKKVYEVSKQGAQIEFASIKFDRLATSIGTTAAALDYDLAQATDGLMSQAERMQLASDLMTLGLVKTSEQAIRMSSVVSQLGMDMNELTLTLTNETKRRFDSLGLAVDGFDQVLQDTIDTGGTFTDAFLTQAERQIEKVGSVADTTAGQIMQFEAVWKDFGDTLKVSTSEAVTPFLDRWTRVMKLLQAGEITRAKANLIVFSDSAIENAEAAAEVDTAWKDFYSTLKKNTSVVSDAASAQDDFNDSIEQVNTSLGNQIEQMIKNIEWNQRGGPIFQKAYDNIIKGSGTAAEKQRQLTSLALNYMETMGELDDMSLEEIAQQVENLGVAEDKAWRIAMGIYGQLNKIDGTSVSANVFIKVHGKVPKLGNTGKVEQGYSDALKDPSGGIPIMLQAGRDFIVPNNMTGDSFPVRATAGERVSVSTASNTRQDAVNQRIMAKRNNRELARMIAEEMAVLV